MDIEVCVLNRHGDRVDPVPFLVTAGIAAFTARIVATLAAIIFAATYLVVLR